MRPAQQVIGDFGGFLVVLEIWTVVAETMIGGGRGRGEYEVCGGTSTKIYVFIFIFIELPTIVITFNSIEKNSLGR